MIRLLLVLSFLATASISAPAAAHFQTYRADLLGSNEVPASSSTGIGTTTVTVDFYLVTLRVQADFSGLSGLVTASHIHCCVDPGSNVGVATQLPSFTDFPLGVSSGSYDHIFDLSNAGSFNPVFITNHGGTIGSAFNALVAGLDAGQAYLNIHTNLFPGGELRGLLAPVPIPAGIVLFAPALIGLLGYRIKSRLI